MGDKGIYEFPLQGGKNRFHPTQKSLALFEELIKKHSNENDIILDTFLVQEQPRLQQKIQIDNFGVVKSQKHIMINLLI